MLSTLAQYKANVSSCSAYSRAKLAYCILTKVDEASSLGEALSAVIEQDLSISYVTQGQSVPDDIQSIKAPELISQAVRLSRLVVDNEEHAIESFVAWRPSIDALVH